jgi:hypothetical protein
MGFSFYKQQMKRLKANKNIKTLLKIQLISIALMLFVWGCSTLLHYFDNYDSEGIWFTYILAYLAIFAFYIATIVLIFLVIKILFSRSEEN